MVVVDQTYLDGLVSREMAYTLANRMGDERFERMLFYVLRFWRQPHIHGMVRGLKDEGGYWGKVLDDRPMRKRRDPFDYAVGAYIGVGKHSRRRFYRLVLGEDDIGLIMRGVVVYGQVSNVVDLPGDRVGELAREYGDVWEYVVGTRPSIGEDRFVDFPFLWVLRRPVRVEVVVDGE